MNVENLYKVEGADDDIYWSPSSVEDEIYSQMHHWNFQEIPRQCLTTSTLLGEGQFGEVYKAQLKMSRGRNLDVAVKLVKKGAPAEERTKFLQEAANLGQFKHRHVVRLIGVMTLGEPVSLIYTYMEI